MSEAAGVDGDGCPELELLEQLPLAVGVRSHVARCEACALVVAVFDVHAARDDDPCVAFDALLAARSDGTLNRAGANLLERHLASCESCRTVAATLSPSADRQGDHALLPSVDPASYALGLEVARGGMGRILAARDLRVGRPVAVKELLVSSPQLAARFEREARVTARLQHPGIVPIYEIGKWPDGTPFYTMRMVDGRTLRAAIDAAPTLADRLALLPQVIAACEAVAFAHGQRVIHRDLTPSNILLGAYGETVVIDWGLAKDLASTAADSDDTVEPYRSDRAPAASLTHAGIVIGTLAYMPPEQANAGSVDERADVYALGAILYHVLAGKPPFAATAPAALLELVRHGSPQPIDDQVPGVPRDLASIITKALARDPDDRYPSARELAAELQRFQTGRLVAAHDYSRRELVWRFVRRHRAAIATTALAAMLAAAFSIVSIVRVIRSRAEARHTARELLLEKGRIELLAGNTFRGLAYLDAAADGPPSPALAFLVGTALHAAEPSSLLDCGGYAYAVALAPDGSSLAAACTNQGMIWRLADRRQLATLGPVEDGFRGLRYSPSGERIVTWGKDAAHAWDPSSGARVASFAHGAEITSAQFTPDGARLLTTGLDGYARIWDARAGTELRAIPVAANRLFRAIYGRLGGDGRIVYTSTLHGEGQAWDAETGGLLGGFDHGGLVLGGDLSSDGALALSCGVDRLAKVWNTRTGALVHTLAGHSDVVWRCIFDPRVRHALTTGHDGRACVWDLETGALVVAVDHGDILTSAEVSADGRRFATIGVDGRAKVWDARSGALLASIDAHRGKHATFLPDGRGLVVQRGDGRLEVWDDPSGQLAAFTPTAGDIVGMSADGTRAVTEGLGGLAVWDVVAGKTLPTPALHAPLAIAAHAPMLAAAGREGVVIVELATGTPIATLPVVPHQLAISADGARLALIGADGVAEVFDVRAARRLARLEAATEMALSGDGKRALLRTAGGFVVWHVDSARRITTLAIADPVRWLGLSHDGDRAILVERHQGDQAVSVWDARRGRLLYREPATSAHVDPSGRWLTTIGTDRLVRTRRLADGVIVSAFEGQQLLDAQIDPRGALIAALGEYGRVALVLDAKDGRVLARWQIEHAPPSVSQTGFSPPSGTASWSADGGTVIARSRGLALWHATSATRDQLAAIMNRVPLRVANGRLITLQDRSLRARVLRAGRPVANARIAIELRSAPELGLGEVTWDSLRTRFTTRESQADAHGRVRIEGLVPGAYRVVVASPDGHSRAFETFVPAGLGDHSEAVLDIAAP